MSKPPNITKARFVKGPKDGDEWDCAKPASPLVRFAFPEWCTYRLDPDGFTYSYTGNQKIVKDSLFGKTRLDDETV